MICPLKSCHTMSSITAIFFSSMEDTALFLRFSVTVPGGGGATVVLESLVAVLPAVVAAGGSVSSSSEEPKPSLANSSPEDILAFACWSSWLVLPAIESLK